jgi:hypothetical protein
MPHGGVPGVWQVHAQSVRVVPGVQPGRVGGWDVDADCAGRSIHHVYFGREAYRVPASVDQYPLKLRIGEVYRSHSARP